MGDSMEPVTQVLQAVGTGEEHGGGEAAAAGL